MKKFKNYILTAVLATDLIMIASGVYTASVHPYRTVLVEALAFAWLGCFLYANNYFFGKD